MTELDDYSDYCPHCGVRLEDEDCYQCHGEGGRDLSDEGLEYEPGEWEDCDRCEGTGVRTFCPNAACPGKRATNMVTPVPDVATFRTRWATPSEALALEALALEATPDRPPIDDRQPDPGARARRKARKVQRQNRQHGRQHAH